MKTDKEIISILRAAIRHIENGGELEEQKEAFLMAYRNYKILQWRANWEKDLEPTKSRVNFRDSYLSDRNDTITMRSFVSPIYHSLPVMFTSCAIELAEAIKAGTYSLVPESKGILDG